MPKPAAPFWGPLRTSLERTVSPRRTASPVPTVGFIPLPPAEALGRKAPRSGKRWIPGRWKDPSRVARLTPESLNPLTPVPDTPWYDDDPDHMPTVR